MYTLLNAFALYVMANLFWLTIWTVLFGWINYSRAKQYNRHLILWIILAFFFGFISTIVLFLLGRRENKNEKN